MSIKATLETIVSRAKVQSSDRMIQASFDYPDQLSRQLPVAYHPHISREVFSRFDLDHFKRGGVTPYITSMVHEEDGRPVALCLSTGSVVMIEDVPLVSRKCECIYLRKIEDIGGLHAFIPTIFEHYDRQVADHQYPGLFTLEEAIPLMAFGQGDCRLTQARAQSLMADIPGLIVMINY